MALLLTRNASIPNSGGVYRIKNIKNGRCYVGSTTRLRHRSNDHFSRLKNGNHHSRHMQNSFNKNGEDNFVFEVLEYCNGGIDYIRSREDWWIEALDATNRKSGYNIRPDANMVSHSEETRKKISEIQRGKIIPPEVKAKMSAAQIGIKKSASHADNLAKAFSFFKDKEKYMELLRLRAEGMSCPQLAKHFGCDRHTVQNTLFGKRRGAGLEQDPIPQEKKTDGRYKPSYTKKQEMEISRIVGHGYSQVSIARYFNLNRDAVFKIKKKYAPSAVWGKKKYNGG